MVTSRPGDPELVRRPYRDVDDAPIVYRRSSMLAKWSPLLAGFGVLLLASALVVAGVGFPWDARTQWLVMGLVATGLPAVFAPSLARRRLQADLSLVDPSDDVRRADAISRVGLSALASLGVIGGAVLAIPVVFVGLWILGIIVGVFNWPFG